MATAPETISIVVREGVRQLCITLIIPIVHRILRIVSIHQRAAVLRVVNEVAPLLNLSTNVIIGIIQIIWAELRILILECQVTQLVVEFGLRSNQILLVDCLREAGCASCDEVG